MKKKRPRIDAAWPPRWKLYGFFLMEKKAINTRIFKRSDKWKKEKEGDG
jgi:hypothetical protein